MSVILQQQTFVASDWGEVVTSSGTATVTQQFAFGVAVTGTLTPGAVVSVAEQNPSHTTLTMTVSGNGANNGFVLVDGSGTDFLFANTTLSVGSQLPVPTGGITSYQAPARNLVWTGTHDTNFSNAANWNDTSNALNPAASAPGGADTAQFLTGGGTITGTGTASALQFGGTALWDVTSAASLTATSGVTVGQGGPGSVLVNGGASIAGLGTSDTITGASGGSASVTVDGSGSAWKSAGELIIGNLGAGSLIISNRAGVTAVATASVPAMVLGVAAGGSGSLSVTGAGSRATLVGQLNVGQAGTGSLSISNQGTAITGGSTLGASEGIDVAQSSGGSGSITVSGTQSLLSNTGEFIVGDAGVGSLAINAGATVVTSPGTVAGLAGLVIANSAGADGSSVNISGISGAISQLNVSGLLDVGAVGSGALSLTGGAIVTAGSLDVGNVAAAIGQINLSGTGTGLTITNGATLADDGTGVMSVLNGATFSAANLTIGGQANSSGALVVSGTGSKVIVSGVLNVGTPLGTGDLTVGPGASIHASVVNLLGGVVLEGGNLDPIVLTVGKGKTAGGTGTIGGDFVVDEGTILASGTKPGKSLQVVTGTIVGGGTLTLNGTIQKSSTVGLLQISNIGTMELTGPVLNAATTTFTDNLTPTGTYVVKHSVVDVSFQDVGQVLMLDDISGFAGTVTAFNPGDQFVITGGTLSNLSASGNNLTVSDSGSDATTTSGIDTIMFNSAVSPAQFSIINGNTIQVACFAGGSRIETELGPVPVEDLRIGDRLITVDGALEPIVWIGKRTIHPADHPEPETIQPIRVHAGAFGPALPEYDLYLSPDHAVFIDDVLVPVKLLINGASIARAERAVVTYYHVELPRHAVILAEGLPVESYLDLGDRANFLGQQETIRLFPDFVSRLAPEATFVWETAGCAELLMGGERLEAIRDRVNSNLARSSRRNQRHAR